MARLAHVITSPKGFIPEFINRIECKAQTSFRAGIESPEKVAVTSKSTIDEWIIQPTLFGGEVICS